MKKHQFSILLAYILILLISSGCAEAFQYSIGCADIKTNQSFSFFIVSDPHYISKETYDNGKAFQDFLASGDGKMLNHTDELLDALIKDIRAEKPDFLIITGDLTCNGTRQSHIELAEKLKTIEDIGTCVFVVPGNHDIQNPYARKYIGDEVTDIETITSEDYVNLYAPFGYEGCVSRDPNSLSYLAMPAEDIWLLMLDSTDTDRNMARKYPEQSGYLRPDTLKWIEQCAALAKENNAKLIAVMHHSLIDHSEMIKANYTIKNSKDALKVFRKHGIEIVFTGHIHIQDIKSDEYQGNRIYDIGTSSLAVYPHQYGRMKYTPYVGFDYRTIPLDMDDYDIHENAKDGTPLNFEDYSACFFTEQCGRMHQECLEQLEGLSDAERELVLETVCRMNMLYFAGYRNEALNDIVNTEGFKKLENIAPCFTKEYALKMLDDERTNNNTLLIPVSSNEKQ